ncbi:hypothetical protein QR680_000070 [Steinernema hermaphroditum]|uniref:Uncharacterized protein n=1 Tax=Steinernema hermaphroditum TaxID=289476 RepID=A0AA39GT76_9BILA|nr:hypothetical protein QR680_000070 [Steinernema hermaphroditum]
MHLFVRVPIRRARLFGRYHFKNCSSTIMNIVVRIALVFISLTPFVLSSAIRNSMNQPDVSVPTKPLNRAEMDRITALKDIQLALVHMQERLERELGYPSKIYLRHLARMGLEFNQDGEPTMDNQSSEKDKRAQTFVRFGKRGQTFIRFG